jgi:hypothetical protein
MSRGRPSSRTGSPGWPRRRPRACVTRSVRTAAPELQALLRAIRADPRHPLVQQIEAETQVEWSDDPVTWSVFQRLMDLLLQAI